MARGAAITALKSGRTLVLGSGTVAQSGRTLTFSAAQNFKQGTVISNASACWTIEEGRHNLWMVQQLAGCGHGDINGSFYMTNPTNSRARGGAAGTTGMPVVPYAQHFVYVSALDSSGVPDAYTYIDTVFPEGGGRHPYTRDACIGSIWGLPRYSCSNPLNCPGKGQWDTEPTICGNTYVDGTGNYAICPYQFKAVNLCRLGLPNGAAMGGFSAGQVRYPGTPGGLSGYLPVGGDRLKGLDQQPVA